MLRSKTVKRVAYGFIAVLTAFCGLMCCVVRLDVPVEELKAKYTNDRSRFLEMDGMSVHFRDEGKGRAILLLHGAQSSLQAWDAWADALSREYRVIRLDLPGYGLTGPNATRDYSLGWYMGFLNRFLTRLGVEECVVGGNSFGGKIAAEFAYREKARVRKLILVDSGGYPSQGSQSDQSLVVTMARSPVLRYVLRYVTPRSWVAETARMAYAHPENVPDRTIDRYYDLFLRAGNRDTFIRVANAEGEPMGDHIKSITSPTLVLWGRQDQVIPMEQAEYFRRDIPNAKAIVYDDSGHFPHEEAPDKTIADVRAFLHE